MEEVVQWLNANDLDELREVFEPVVISGIMSGKAELCEAKQEKETAPINNSKSTTSGSKEIKNTGLIASVTYYFNRFRYYHFYCSDKVEKGLMIVILWLGRVLFNRDLNQALNGY